MFQSYTSIDLENKAEDFFLLYKTKVNLLLNYTIKLPSFPSQQRKMLSMLKFEVTVKSKVGNIKGSGILYNLENK